MRIFYIIGICLLIPTGFFVDALRCFEMDEQAGFEKVVRTLPVKATDAGGVLDNGNRLAEMTVLMLPSMLVGVVCMMGMRKKKES